MTQEIHDAVHLTRTLDATRDLVWRMWTDPDEFAAWYGPGGATITVTEWDLHAGGGRQVTMEMETPRGPMTMTFVGTFVEVSEPERLAYTESVVGQDHPETRVEVRFAEDGGRTTLDVVHHGIPAGSPGEAGWAAALETLGARVRTA